MLVNFWGLIKENSTLKRGDSGPIEVGKKNTGENHGNQAWKKKL